MDIQNPMRKLLHEPGRQQPHVSGEANQIYVVLLQRGDDFTIMFLARLALRWNDQRIQATLAGSYDSRRIRPIGDDYRNQRIRNAARIDAVSDSDEVRPAPGKEYAEGMHFLAVSNFAFAFNDAPDGVSLLADALQHRLSLLEFR